MPANRLPERVSCDRPSAASPLFPSAGRIFPTAPAEPPGVHRSPGPLASSALLLRPRRRGNRFGVGSEACRAQSIWCRSPSGVLSILFSTAVTLYPGRGRIRCQSPVLRRRRSRRIRAPGGIVLVLATGLLGAGGLAARMAATRWAGSRPAGRTRSRPGCLGTPLSPRPASPPWGSSSGSARRSRSIFGSGRRRSPATPSMRDDQSRIGR